VNNVPEVPKIAKILSWTELGHVKEYFGLVGLKNGLLGLCYVTIRWLFPTTKTFTYSRLRQ